MERRVLLAIFLAFLTLYVWQALFAPPPPERPGGAPEANEPSVAATALGAPSEPGIGERAPAPAAPGATPLVSDVGERDIRVETRDIIATFTNRGARLKSWQLKRYKGGNGEPLELVPTGLPASQPLPFSLGMQQDDVARTLNEALFSVTGAPSGRSAESRSTQVIFEYRDSAGLRAVKEFRFEPSSYVVTVLVSVAQGDRDLVPAVQWGPGLGDLGAEAGGRYIVQPGGVFSIGGEVERVTPGDVATQPSYEGNFQFAGVDDHYFLTTALDPGPSSKITFQQVVVPSPPGSEESARPLMAYAIEPGRRGEPLKFYVGPKDFDRLAEVDRALVRAINFGVFTIIVVPLLRTLNWLNGFIGNYGWSIILLTVIMNALMFPLRHKSVVSMRKMQEIQPEAKVIQDRYAKLKKTDPAKGKMNQELMTLYRERGVNPAGGCVPMLLTMPVLFSFYSLLTVAIELRGAPFIGWINDLSLPDPYFVTPILMGASQFWQQWMTPQNPGVDPVQQKIMMFMPLMFVFFFLWAPSGVAIYWFVSNLWGIGQQYLTNYLIGPPSVRHIRPAAERRVKTVGSGATEAARKP